MNEFRTLSTTESQFLLNTYQNNPGRKLIHIFFGIWKGMFLFTIIGAIYSIVITIQTKDLFNLLSLFTLPFGYLFFWMFPSFLLKQTDKKYDAVKAGRVAIRETILADVRLHKERRSGDSRQYRTIYYATVWDETGTQTYEVTTDEYVYSLAPGCPVCVIRFFTNPNNPNYMEEIVVSSDFVYNPAYSTYLINS